MSNREARDAIRRYLTACLVLIGLLLGCSLTTGSDAAPYAPSPTATPNPVGEEWEPLAAGVWMQEMLVEAPYTARSFALAVLRFDPAQVLFRAHYIPNTWYTIAEWGEVLDEPLLVINANFFSEDASPIGLVISDGKAYGSSLQGFGGMMQVGAEGIRLRSLAQEPYNFEGYDQAVQGFPMLVNPGGEAARTGDGFDDPAARTIIAQGSDGHIYIMVSPSLFDQFTLRNAQAWLLDSGLDIQAALNMDGGRSSSLYLNTPERELLYPAINPIPVVLAVYPR